MDDVAIVGVGLHPFGRFPGVTAHRHGRDRDPARARRRGRRVARHPVRVRRQLRGRQPRRGRRAARAHRHPVHRRLQRVRDRGERADAGRQHDPARRPRPRHRGRHGQAPPRRVHRRPAPVRVPVVVRRGRPVPHDEVLRDEDQQVHARPRDLAPDARQGRGEELPQRRAEPERVPAQAAVGGGDPRVADAQLPAHAVHVLQPRRRRGRGGAVPGRARAPLHRHADLPAGHDRAHPPARRVRGAQPVAPDRGDGRPDGRRVRAPRTRWRASVPKTST